MTDALHAAARDAFPDRTLESLEPCDTRPGNETALVRFADGERAYLKTATDETYRLVREAAATRYAGEHCDVGVPEVLASAPDGGVPYLATAPLPGTAITDVWRDDDVNRERLVRAAGRGLAAVHEARFDRPGRVVGGDESGLHLAGDSWTDVLCATVEERDDDWFADRFADVPGRIVDVLRDASPLLDGAPAALLHGDAARPNVHVGPTGFLDWERALVGDPAMDLVDSVGHNVDQPDVPDAENDRLTDAMLEGYRERAGGLPAGFAERRPVYRLFHFLLVPQTFEDWSRAADAPDDDLAADVRDELDDRLEAARAAVDAA